MTIMSDEDLSGLRKYIASHSSSSVQTIRDLVGHVTTGLSSIARRSMIPADARGFLTALLEMGSRLASPSILSAIRSMLVELDGYGVTSAELRLLKDFCLGGSPEALTGLRRAIDVAIFSRSFGIPLEDRHRAEIASFVASECDSVALAAASLLRAVDVAERGARRIDPDEGRLVDVGGSGGGESRGGES